jgi:hypothetical protein
VLVVVPVVPVVPVEPVVPVVVAVVLVPVVLVPVVVPVVPVVLVPVVFVPVVPVVLVPVVACPHAGNENTNRKVRATNIVLMYGTDFPLRLIYLTNPLTIAYLRKQCNDLGKREVASSPSAAKGIRTLDNTSTTTSETLNFGESLSEKGYQPRSDGRFFGRYTGGERTDRFLLGCSQGYTVGASETFGQFQ